MRVMVTGHAGYIGAVMVPALLAAGHDLAGLDSGFFSAGGLPLSLTPIPELHKDIRDVEPADLSGFEAVVHLAGLCNDPLGDIDASLTAEINYRASVRLARLARDAGVRRFLFASSCSIYGALAGDDLMTEEAPLSPLTPYAESKARVEEELARLADRNFSPVYLRNATAYGLSPRLRLDVVLNNLVGWAHTVGQVRVSSDGTPWRPIVHVEDIARAFVACLEAPRAAIHNQAFNVGRNEENYQVRDLAAIVREVVPGTAVEYGRNSSPDPRSYRVECSKLPRQVPQFQPIWDARSGALQLYRAMKEYGLDREAFLGPRFVRLQQIRWLMDLGSLDSSLRWVPAHIAA